MKTIKYLGMLLAMLAFFVTKTLILIKNMMSYIKSKLYPHTYCSCGDRYIVTTDELEGFAEYYCENCGNCFTDDYYNLTNVKE